jgi:hypothetical protein
VKDRAGHGRRGIRCIASVVVATLLGGLTTVGLAWRAAQLSQGGGVWLSGYWSGAPRTAYDEHFKYFAAESRDRWADGREVHFIAVEPSSVRTGPAARELSAEIPSLDALNSTDNPGTSRWTDDTRRAVQQASPERGFDVAEVQWKVGWPWRSMSLTARAQRAAVCPTRGAPRIETLPFESDGMIIDGSWVLPVHPHWPGFGLNWCVCAAVWLAILVVPRTGWRMGREWERRWRGYCPSCGYDLRADLPSGCPECGWNRPDPRPKGPP